MPKRTGAQRQLLSDDEIRERMKANPEVQESIRKALERSRNGSDEAGMTADELRDFLREHEEALESQEKLSE